MPAFAVIRTLPFDSLAQDNAREHPAFEEDLEWLIGRLAEAPDRMGNHVPELSKLALPIFKTRCKDSCHRLGASGGWRLYYAIDKPAAKVILLFIHHKKDYEIPRQGFLLQKLERALPPAT
jgi:hypothetical protein